MSERNPSAVGMELQFSLEQERLTKKQQSLRQTDNQRRAEAREAELEAARQQKIDENRARADADLRAQLHADFMGANPSASEGDFSRLFSTLRDEHLLREATEAPAREKAALRATGEYAM
jgi:hypothetical protein